MSQLERRRWTRDLGLLLVLATVRVALHALSNHQYGWHRDELAMLDDARHLAWGYVAYPPLTPAIGSLALGLFGPSLVGVRLFSSLAQAAGMVLAGLIARDLGGRQSAQVLTALAVAIAPISLIQGAMFQYVSFDYLWWVATAYAVVRLLKTDDPRWWLAIGALLGLGMMTKYTMAFWVAALVGGVLLTDARRYLRSPWLWAGVALSLLIFSPNLIWQTQNDFISVDFLRSINARDVRIGRTSGFLPEQVIVPANPVTIPLWVAGLDFFFRRPDGKRYRLLGWMFLIAFGLMWAMNGRSYYLGPAYPMLIAAGAVVWEGWVSRLAQTGRRVAQTVTWGLLAMGGVVFASVMTPVAPINSDLWRLSNGIHDNFREQVGWPDLTETVAGIYAGLSDDERSRTGILTRNYGQAGAINLYGPAYGLPTAISGVNSYWLRGYGDPAPEIVITIGYDGERARQFFRTCDLVGRVTNRFGVENEETGGIDSLFVCRDLRRPWPEIWNDLKAFG